MTDYTITLTESGGTISGSISPSATGGGVNNNAWDISPNDRVRWTNSTGLTAGNISITVASGLFTSNAALSVYTGNTTAYKTVASGTASNQLVSYGLFDENTFTFYGGSNYFDKVASSAPTAPSGITFGSDPGTASSTVSITATATGGSGGTMKVSENGTTWVANGSSFTFTRNVQKPIYARTEGSSSNSSSITRNHTVGYISADLAISVAPTTTTLSATNTDNITITVSNGTANNQYRVLRTTNGNSGRGNTGILTGTSGTVVLHSSDTGDIPSAGNTYNYVIQGRVPTSKGGNDTYATTNGSFSITRSAAAQDTTPDNFVDFTPRTGAAPSTTQTSTSQTITGITGNVNVSVSGDGSPSVSINGGSFTSSPGTISNGQTIQARLTSSATAGGENVADITIGTVTKEFSVTTASAGGSGSGTSSSSSNYGIEIYDTNGTTTVLSPTTRYITILNDASSVTIPAKVNGVNGSTLLQLDMTGLTTSNSDVTFTEVLGNFVVEVSRVTTGSNQGFLLENTSNSAITVTPLVLRY